MSFSVLLLPRAFTLFPYTTLFRSPESPVTNAPRCCPYSITRRTVACHREYAALCSAPIVGSSADCAQTCSQRSEEHTSELQSRGHLVCRLLLEKKKIITESYACQR